jgi:TonB family protein
MRPPAVLLVLAALSLLVACDGLALAVPVPGAIRVHAVAGQGELYLDGVARGPVAAEQELAGLRAGTHIVELRRGSEVVVSMPVEVREGMIADVRLEAPGLAGPPATVIAPPPPGPARYRIASQPIGAEVLVDGVLVGRTPLEIELAPGAHQLELRADGYRPLTQSIDASDGVPRALDLALVTDAPDGLPRIRTGGADVRGSLSRDVIRNVIRRHIDEVRSCYERELARTPTLAGRVTVSFIISATGAVQTAAISSTTMNDPTVEACLVHAVRRWVFPAPDGGGVVGVNYPFVFDSAR